MGAAPKLSKNDGTGGDIGMEKVKNELRIKVNNRASRDKLARLKLLAAERNARVLLCSVPETYALMDMGMALDQAIKRLRNGIMVTLPVEQVIPALKKINVAMCVLEEAVKEAGQLTGINWYKTPRGIKKLRRQLHMDLAEQKDFQNHPADVSNMDTV
jgi:hypothetical protein